MTKVTCPFCGSSMEVGVALRAGQHVICSCCENKFTYGEYNAAEAKAAEAQCQQLVDVSCPHCGTVYEVDQSEYGGSAICQVCNREFVVGQREMNDASAEKALDEEQRSVKFCGECGAKMPLEAAYCPKCGREVQTEEEKSTEQKFADTSNDAKYSREEQYCGTAYEIERSERGGGAICHNKELIAGQREMNEATAEKVLDEDQRSVKFCVECGAKMSVEAAYCPKCGRKVPCKWVGNKLAATLMRLLAF